MCAVADATPDGFVSLEHELPTSDGWYELWAMLLREGRTCRGTVEAYYSTALCGFEPIRGILAAYGWREMLPDAADIEEFHERERQGAVWI